MSSPSQQTQASKDLLRNYIISIQDHASLARSDIDTIGGPNEETALHQMYIALDNIARAVQMAKRVVFREQEKYEDRQ